MNSGKCDGDKGNVMVASITETILKKIDILIDLHTASKGRENSLYVRADVNDHTSKIMAVLTNPEIIVWFSFLFFCFLVFSYFVVRDTILKGTQFIAWWVNARTSNVNGKISNHY